MYMSLYIGWYTHVYVPIHMVVYVCISRRYKAFRPSINMYLLMCDVRCILKKLIKLMAILDEREIPANIKVTSVDLENSL